MSPPPPLERDYVGLSERPEEIAALYLKHIELRLGLRGGGGWSESLGREDGAGLWLTLGLAESCASGAKRGISFSDEGENAGGKDLGPAMAEKDDGGEEKAAQPAKAQAVGWPADPELRKEHHGSKSN